MFRTMLFAAVLAAVVPSPSSAQPTPSKNGAPVPVPDLAPPAKLAPANVVAPPDLETAVKRFNEEAAEIAKVAGQPDRIDASKWIEVGDAAGQLKRAVLSLRTNRAKILERFGKFDQASSALRTEFENVAATFDVLSAESDADRLVKTKVDDLRGFSPIFEGEAAKYRIAAVRAREAGATFATLVRDARVNLVFIDSCEPLLQRLERAADSYDRLAKAGFGAADGLATLREFATETNRIIEQMGALNAKISDAVNSVKRSTPAKTGPDPSK